MLVASVADKDCSSQSLHSTLTVPQLIVQTSLDHKPPARILICGKQQIASLLVEQLKPFFWGLVFNTWDVQFRMWWVESEISEKKLLLMRCHVKIPPCQRSKIFGIFSPSSWEPLVLCYLSASQHFPLLPLPSQFPPYSWGCSESCSWSSTSWRSCPDTKLTWINCTTLHQHTALPKPLPSARHCRRHCQQRSWLWARSPWPCYTSGNRGSWEISNKSHLMFLNLLLSFLDLLNLKCLLSLNTCN